MGPCPEAFGVDELVEAMTFDKKGRHDLRFVLAGSGWLRTGSGVEPSMVGTVLRQFKGEI